MGVKKAVCVNNPARSQKEGKMKKTIVVYGDNDELLSIRDFPNDQQIEEKCLGYTVSFRAGFLACIDYLTSHLREKEEGKMGHQNSYYKQYLDYIKNTGGSPLIEHFDYDWEPIGPLVRRDLKQDILIYERDGKIFLVEGGGDG